MRQQLLLIEDIEGLGRSGDIVTGAAPGYVRNFLLPQQKAVLATKATVRKREQLQAKRQEQAARDKKEAELLAERMQGLEVTLPVKVDVQQHMYGSVTGLDVEKLLGEQGYVVAKRSILLAQPIKALGDYPLTVRLPEGVTASVLLHVVAE